MQEPRTFVVIHREEPAKKSFWVTLEKVSKVLSIAALPIVIALVGFYIQETIHQDEVNKDFVGIAMQFLSAGTNTDPELQQWARKVLARYSPPGTIELAPRNQETIADALIKSKMYLEGINSIDTQIQSLETDISDAIRKGQEDNGQIDTARIANDLNQISSLKGRKVDFENALTNLHAAQSQMTNVYSGRSAKH